MITEEKRRREERNGGEGKGKGKGGRDSQERQEEWSDEIEN